MASPRLLFLWPTLWRRSATELYAPAARSAKASARSRALHASSYLHQQERSTQRYGTANEPPPHLGGGKGLGPATTRQAEPEEKPSARQQTSGDEKKALPKIGEKLQRDGELEARAESQKIGDSTEQKTTPSTIDARHAGDRNLIDAARNTADTPLPDLSSSPIAPDGRPTDSVLESVPAPANARSEGESQQQAEPERSRRFDEHARSLKAPHIDTPRHVHHFDTYGLVKHLVEGGWDETHAITIMKAVRLMLADNTNLAQEALVSKSNLENEEYLFKAACAELRTEVISRRRAEQQKMRTERTALQHEVEILGQRLGQESANLKDELKGMFDDRKMAVRNEQREMESNLQQLNQRITVSLQADAKSDIEGLRWVMTRRVIITLAVVVLMVLGSLKLYSNEAREAEEMARRRSNQRSGGTQTETDHAQRREAGGGEMVVKEGDNPAFVSLG